MRPCILIGSAFALSLALIPACGEDSSSTQTSSGSGANVASGGAAGSGGSADVGGMAGTVGVAGSSSSSDVPLGTVCYTVGPYPETCATAKSGMVLASRSVKDGKVMFDVQVPGAGFAIHAEMPDGASLPRDANTASIAAVTDGTCNVGDAKIDCQPIPQHTKCGVEGDRNIQPALGTADVHIQALSVDEVVATASATAEYVSDSCEKDGLCMAFGGCTTTFTGPAPTPITARLHVAFLRRLTRDGAHGAMRLPSRNAPGDARRRQGCESS